MFVGRISQAFFFWSKDTLTMINMISCLLIACLFLSIGKLIFGVQEHDWSNIDFIDILVLTNISLLTYLLTFSLACFVAFLCFMRLWHALFIFDWYVNFPKTKLTYLLACLLAVLSQLWPAFSLLERFLRLTCLIVCLQFYA